MVVRAGVTAVNQWTLVALRWLNTEVSLRKVGLMLLVVSSFTYFIYYAQLTLLQSDLSPYSINEITTENRSLVNLTVRFNNTPYPGVENYTWYAVTQLGLLPIDDAEPLIPKFGPVINDVLSFEYPISIPPCRNNLTVKQTVIILVNSAPGNFDRRKIIRQTWKNRLNALYDEDLMGIAGFGFVLGLTEDNVTQRHIEEEAKTNGDIIQIGMSDFYRNLSLKVAGLFNWLYRNCKKVDFVVKVDDDVFVNLRNLAHFFRSYNQSNPLSMFGSAAGNLWPARDGKWKMSYEDWPWNSYPPYFLGPTVIFPSSVIIPLLAAFQTTPMLDIDDVYYTGVCREKAGVKLYTSTESTSVFVMGLPELPLPCDVRRLMTWLTVSQNHMNSSHVAVDDFYRNVTQCVITNSNGVNSTVDYNEPVQFNFI